MSRRVARYAALLAAVSLTGPAVAVAQPEGQRAPAREELENAGDLLEESPEPDEPEEADEDEGTKDAPQPPAPEQPATPPAPEPPATLEADRVPMKPLYANSTFVLGGGNGAFSLAFGLEAALQFTVLEDASADPENRPAPAPYGLRNRSTLLFIAAKFYEKFGIVSAFFPSPDPLRSQDTLAVFVGFAYANFKPWLRLKTGMLFVPFGREFANYFYAMRTIERSVSIESTVPARDTGIIVEGDLSKQFDYRVGVITGSGPRFVPVEEEPDLVVHFGYRPIDEVSLGVSGQIGKQPHDINGLLVLSPLRASRNSLMLVSDTQGLRSRVGADFLFEKGPFALQAEFAHEITARDDIVLNAAGDVGNGTIDASSVRQMGGYVEAGLFVMGSQKGGVELVAKVDHLRTESVSTKDDEGNTIVDIGDAVIYPLKLTNYTAGFNYWIHPTTTFQVNGIITDLKREAVNGMAAPIDTYLDNRTSWAVLTQLRFWIAPPI